MAKSQGGDAARPSRRRDDNNVSAGAASSGRAAEFTPGDTDAMDQWGKDGYSALNLSDTETRALESYQEDGYFGLNKNLRENGQLTDRQIRDRDGLDSVFARARTPTEVTVFRGIGQSLDLDKLVIGATMSDKAYSSTSLNQNISTAFSSNQTIARIRVPKGTKAVYMDTTIGKYGGNGEQELLLGRGAKFVVTRRSTETITRYGTSADYTIIDMDLVSTD